MQIQLHWDWANAADDEISVYIEPFLEIPWRRVSPDALEVDDVYPPEDVRVSRVRIPRSVPQESRAVYRRNTMMGNY
ncbi:hypothetical protein [Rhizobium rhizogenes]|uniref:hypothetical protein n=1 Tax=Rhizobium rhizogenes TaxID=359 RepID=UPI001572260D|nr:hypothetical protein [Rhizobium rhizogenes]NTF67701.1 hypothetical protein [Rhizobium rhizogenes]